MAVRETLTLQARGEFVTFTTCGVRVCDPSLPFSPSAWDMVIQTISLARLGLGVGGGRMCQEQNSVQGPVGPVWADQEKTNPEKQNPQTPKDSVALEVEPIAGLLRHCVWEALSLGSVNFLSNWSRLSPQTVCFLRMAQPALSFPSFPLMPPCG